MGITYKDYAEKKASTEKKFLYDMRIIYMKAEFLGLNNFHETYVFDNYTLDLSIKLNSDGLSKREEDSR
jgi:hypothetical protein